MKIFRDGMTSLREPGTLSSCRIRRRWERRIGSNEVQGPFRRAGANASRCRARDLDGERDDSKIERLSFGFSVLLRGRLSGRADRRRRESEGAVDSLLLRLFGRDSLPVASVLASLRGRPSLSDGMRERVRVRRSPPLLRELSRESVLQMPRDGTSFRVSRGTRGRNDASARKLAMEIRNRFPRREGKVGESGTPGNSNPRSPPILPFEKESRSQERATSAS